MPGIAVLHWSDWHAGSVGSPSGGSLPTARSSHGPLKAKFVALNISRVLGQVAWIQASRQHPWDHLRQWESKINREDKTYHNNARKQKFWNVLLRCLYTVTMRDKAGIKLHNKLAFFFASRRWTVFYFTVSVRTQSQLETKWAHNYKHFLFFHLQRWTLWHAIQRLGALQWQISIYVGNILSSETYTAGVKRLLGR